MRYALIIIFCTLLKAKLAYASPDSTQGFDSTKIIKWGAELGATTALSGTSPNWSGGAANNLSGNFYIRAFYNLKYKRQAWDNILKINAGAISSTMTDNLGNKFRSTRKNMDNVFIDSKYGVSFDKATWLSGFGGLNLQTQLLPGYNYSRDANGKEVKSLVSSFLSQGSLMSAIGFEAKPSERFYGRLALFSLKQTFMLNQSLYEKRNQSTIAGVNKGQYIRSEQGFQIQTGFNREFNFNKQILIRTNYLAFIPYNFKRNPSPVDSRIDAGLTIKLTRYLNFNYTLISIFDKDLSRPGENAWQNSWVLGLGFLYKF
jgi:hypothetical protein